MLEQAGIVIFSEWPKLCREETMMAINHTPWYLWPFVALWRLLATILNLTGRLLGLVLGLVLLIAGLALSVTVIGALIGIPLMIFGLLLMIRGLF
jgi:hypothetical protein